MVTLLFRSIRTSILHRLAKASHGLDRDNHYAGSCPGSQQALAKEPIFEL